MGIRVRYVVTVYDSLRSSSPKITVDIGSDDLIVSTKAGLTIYIYNGEEVMIIIMIMM